MVRIAGFQPVHEGSIPSGTTITVVNERLLRKFLVFNNTNFSNLLCYLGLGT